MPQSHAFQTKSSPNATAAVYTSASCNSQTGHGAWGLFSPDGNRPVRDAGHRSNTTANHLGLLAITQTLEKYSGDKELMFVCANAYIVDNFCKQLDLWAETGWNTCNNRMIANLGLWQCLYHARSHRKFNIRRASTDDADHIEEAKRLAKRKARAASPVRA